MNNKLLEANWYSEYIAFKMVWMYFSMTYLLCTHMHLNVLFHTKTYLQHL